MDLVETADLFLNGDGSGIGGRDLIRKMAEEIKRLREERDKLYGYTNGLLGLTQLVRSREDMSPGISEVLRTNHRAADAAAYLTQILPPSAQ